MEDKELVFIRGLKDLIHDAPILIVIFVVFALIGNRLGAW